MRESRSGNLELNVLYSRFCLPCGSKSDNKKKRDKYIVFAGKLRQLYNMRVTVISLVIGELGNVLEGLERNCNLEDESRPSRLQHCYDLLEYKEQFGWVLLSFRQYSQPTL